MNWEQYAIFFSIKWSMALFFGVGMNILAAQEVIPSEDQIVTDSHNVIESLAINNVVPSGFYATGTLGVHGSSSLVISSKNTILDHAIVVGSGALEFRASVPQVIYSTSSSIENLIANNDVSVTILGGLEITNKLTVKKGILDASQARLVHLKDITIDINAEANASFIPPSYQQAIGFYYSSSVLSYYSGLDLVAAMVLEFDNVGSMLCVSTSSFCFCSDGLINYFNEAVTVPPPERTVQQLNKSVNHISFS